MKYNYFNVNLSLFIQNLFSLYLIYPFYYSNKTNYYSLSFYFIHFYLLDESSQNQLFNQYQYLLYL